MTRRGWWLAAGLVVVLAVVVLGVGVALRGGESPDCEAVRAVVEESDRFHDAVAGDVNGGTASATDRDEQVARIAAHAAEVHDAGLARRARDVADLAGRMSGLAARERTADFAAQFSRIGAEFNANLMALSQACPDPGDRIRIGAPS
ncbi:hypothetical protein O6P37_27240 [Mycobacterium sp. CPCC 205372]|uniref:Uncharacterized protein n=1 Tax=Mycobacterium hippophais TaxID=3016340 RepID=A0ABT4Q139_9MYCO|nr:hypothetical protein [Mycobacterium hippophais]MCZ8382570.1 hypothetical protein [Mycobacterium hippophais]